jgi:hypothetical protein
MNNTQYEAYLVRSLGEIAHRIAVKYNLNADEVAQIMLDVISGETTVTESCSSHDVRYVGTFEDKNGEGDDLLRCHTCHPTLIDRIVACIKKLYAK